LSLNLTHVAFTMMFGQRMFCLAAEDKPLHGPDLFSYVTTLGLVLYHWVIGLNPPYLIAWNCISR